MRRGINGKKGLGFYTLRHTFRTVADAIPNHDLNAIDVVMGHESTHVSRHYREHVADDRLLVVTEHVRSWLFPKKQKKARAAEPGPRRQNK